LLVQSCSLFKLAIASFLEFLLMLILLSHALTRASFSYFARRLEDCTTMILLALLEIKSLTLLFALLFGVEGLS
jgi:uncharacterized integral membrane protein